MIRYHKILSGLLTAALILGNYTAVSASDHAPEQHQTEESQDSAESASKALEIVQRFFPRSSPNRVLKPIP